MQVEKEYSGLVDNLIGGKTVKTKEDLNSKSIASLDFMGRYAGLEVEINDGRIVDHVYFDKVETPDAGANKM